MSKTKDLERLVVEARELMLLVGESDKVDIQFRQHRWLCEVNSAIPIPCKPTNTPNRIAQLCGNKVCFENKLGHCTSTKNGFLGCLYRSL